MKVIFLDVDGVLNSQLQFDRNAPISTIAVSHLKEIVDATNAKIVLSSTWRIGWNREGENRYKEILVKTLADFGLEIMDITPIRNDRERGLEINDWMSCKDIESYVILDDDDSKDITPYHPNNHVQTFGFYGLCRKHVKQSIKILNNH